MDDVNLKELFRYILAKCYVVILVLIAVLSVGVLCSVYLKTPMYKSSTKVVLTYEKNANT
jgi:capsular polysaccharide biosynthesis protein